MEMIYFALVALGLYFVSDWILNRIEIRQGERLEQRSVIFFAIMLVLSLVTFSLIDYLTQG